jgi:carbonic anhydrase
MKNLLPGLRKYSTEIFPEQKDLFDELALGQTPHTLMITCSDSRIDPSLLTQTSPGEIFVMRNAGNIIPPFSANGSGEEATIEFAVDVLKVRNIVVCGHSMCGAMSGLMNPETLKTIPSVEKWLKYADSTKRRILSVKENPTNNEVTEENVLAQIDNLKTHPSVASALLQKRVHIFGWFYHFENGQVTIYDKENKKFLPSSDVKENILQNIANFEL